MLDFWRRYRHIMNKGFHDELHALCLDSEELITRGGGDVKARRENGQTILLFSGISVDYGEFDKNLLRKILDVHLNKKIKYEIN